ncbi:MAG TPA: mechanosensitive ion channel family protein [Candidatus Saccharibacteria bacterium]|nr:mechanosensitive ion channel family protein [Candidatus Saccharibacteria bacterium]HMT55837.1 mechanosensitive ion channel family protein [Candidatus Saccharibacteria bacterium]
MILLTLVADTLSRQDADEWFTRNYQALLHICIILLFCWILSRLAHGLLSRLLKRIIRRDLYPTKNDREKRVKTLSGLGSALIRFVIWVTGGISIINILGVNTAPFLASAGVLGVALGFGAQKLINDLVSGIFIILENQYRVGDFVELEGVSGTVEDVTIRTTVLRDLNGAVHHVPNGAIVVSTNRSMGFGQINLDIAVDPKTNLKKLESVIDLVGKAVAEDPELADEIIEAPQFSRVSDFTGSAITVKVLGKTTGGKQLEIKSIFYRKLKNAFDKEGIDLAITPSLLSSQQKKK